MSMEPEVPAQGILKMDDCDNSVVYQGEICYMSQDDDQSFGMWCPVNCDTDHGFPNETKFYTEPPNREWVGLTNDEIDNLNLSNKIKIKQLILLIETKLKEKNLCR